MGLVRHFFIFFWLCGTISFFSMAYYMLVVGIEFVRAKDAGELPDVPWARVGGFGPRGLPVQVLFTDRLPAVCVQRLRFIFWFSAFVGSLLGGFFVGTAFGSKW